MKKQKSKKPSSATQNTKSTASTSPSKRGTSNSKTQSLLSAIAEARQQILHSAQTTLNSTFEIAGKASDITQQTARNLTAGSREAIHTASAATVAYASTVMPLLATPELISWLGKLTQGTSTMYDKAMDLTYLQTSIGGGAHRLFDGGHDLVSAWKRCADASPDDSVLQEISGYISGVWKDVTTTNGLPFITLEKASYDEWANTIQNAIPFMDKKYPYDLLSFDALEIIGSSVGVVGAVFCLNKNDHNRFAEILGGLGVSSIASASPLMAITVIALAALAFAQGRPVNFTAVGSGAMMTGVSSSIFLLLGMPVLIELVIVLVVGNLVKKHILNNEGLSTLIRDQIKLAGHSGSKFKNASVSEILKLIDSMRSNTQKAV